jgi:membrane-bound ClpP family serine protease
LSAGETGSIFVQGEWWNARLTSGQVAANAPVRVLAREGLTLTVEPIHNASVAVVSPSVPGAQPTQPDKES